MKLKKMQLNTICNMKEELTILCSEEITKDVAVRELSYSCNLSQDEVDEYLEIIIAINDNQQVFNISTNKGDFLMYINGDEIKNTICRYRNKDM